MALSETDLPILTSVPPIECPPKCPLAPPKCPSSSMSTHRPWSTLTPLPQQPPLSPTSYNYFGPPISRGPPPSHWAPGPPPGNAGQPPGSGPPNGRPQHGWGPAMDNFSSQHSNGDNYYYYYNARSPPQTQNVHNDTHNALAQEGKLNILKLESFTCCHAWKWRILLMQCLTMFQAKPIITFQLESSQVAFATSYLQGITFTHYTVLLQFDPNNSMLSYWLAFTQEFSSKFGVFDTVAEAEENLFNLWMHDNKHFTTFIGILCLAPKQTTYNGYKALVTQVDQCYWEDWSGNTAPQTTWNTSGNTNWQARATNSNQLSAPITPVNPMPHFPQGQGPPSANHPPGPCPPAQLNAVNLHKALKLLDTSPDNS
ncbi:hypothetical protein E4T56_gene824 [Termitomyces sp. T112]|nr:hypothetical protein E4T56_gene824 [Termitomyces sp. T112]